ncbi:MAG: hypothetical protein JO294_05890 [Alphaproteobacteria bacterium]|nr:hypothetical protein [Alphaproteobacteria bacterium]
MYVLSNSPKYTCKACRNKIAIDTLETVFHHQLRDFFFSPEDIAKHLADADLVLKQKSELLGALQREEEKLQGESEKLYQLYLSGNLSAEGFGAKNRGIEERLAQLRDTLPRLQGECDFLRIKSLSAEEIVEEARDLYSRWPSLDFEAKRWIVENITEEIRIGDGDISIDLCYLPLTSEMKNPSSSELLANGVRTYGPSGNSGTRR